MRRSTGPSRARATATASSPPWRSASARAARKHRDHAHLHAAGFQGPDEQPPRLRLLAGARAAAIRLVPAAHNRDDVIRNLYLVGAGTHPGAGLPGVIGSAKATASLILEGGRPRAAGGMTGRDRIDQESELALRRGSRSFNAAAMLLEPATRDSARLLYAWCRHVDDIIDGQSSAPGRAMSAPPRERLADLRAATSSAWHGGAAGRSRLRGAAARDGRATRSRSPSR